MSIMGGRSPDLTGCSFLANTANRDGGGLNNQDGDVTLANCMFVGNSANRGGGLSTRSPHMSLVNSTFSGNTASREGGAIFITNEYHAAGLTLTNCIVWGNGDEVQLEVDNAIEDVIMTHTCIRGCWIGDGNVCQDPMLARTPGPGADQTWGSADDDYGDLRIQRGSPCIDGGDNSAVPSYVPSDFEGDPRVADGDGDAEATVDMGIDEYWADCNHNGVHDDGDILVGTSDDLNGNWIPDECEDCNENGLPDVIDILYGDDEDCNENWIPDACDISSGTSVDLDGDGVPDDCSDCNTNGVRDDEDLANCDGSSWCDDCNANGILDVCDVNSGDSLDWNGNGLPDDCDPDCNENDLPDFLDIIFGISQDRNFNGVPDECDVPGDLDGDGDCDLGDYAPLAACMEGPGVYSPPGCVAATDLDQDWDADLADFALFQAAFGKSAP
jgi:hypothetical protein